MSKEEALEMHYLPSAEKSIKTHIRLSILIDPLSIHTWLF
jgi:hypothetical protein